jgi:hypothetical protein
MAIASTRRRLEADYRPGDLASRGRRQPRDRNAGGGDRRLGHPTATPSAMRNTVLVARVRGRPSSGRLPGDPASEF